MPSSPTELRYRKPMVGLLIKSVFRLTRSSIDKERVRSSKSNTEKSNSTSSIAGNDACAPVQRIVTGISKLFLLSGLIGYLMIHKGQNVNNVLFLWNGIIVLAMLVSVSQDVFIEQYYSSAVLKWWANAFKSSVPSATTRTATTVADTSNGSPKTAVFSKTCKMPCPVEYNILVQLVIGFILYSIALAVLLLLDDTTASNKGSGSQNGSLAHQFMSLATSKVEILFAGTNNSSTDWNANIGQSQSTGTIPFFIRYVIQGITERWKQLMLGCNDNNSCTGNEVLMQVVSILASYHMFERTWWALFCFTWDEYVNNKEGYFHVVQSNIIFPTLLIFILLIKSNLYEALIESWNLNPLTFHKAIRTVLCGWIIYKLVDFAWSWKTLTSSSTSNSNDLEPCKAEQAKVDSTELLDKTAHDDKRCASSPLLDHDIPRSGEYKNGKVANIWNIYGNQYDVADFVKFHPGGEETIMLAANRDDATALFQSYHPFNIKKARSVLEKYRINTTTTSPIKDSDTTSSSVATEFRELIHYGHYNDIFYDVLCQRVAECLKQEYNIDPITGRDATYQRLAFYAFIIFVNGFCLYKYCQGNLMCSFILGFFGSLASGHIGHDGGHFAISRQYPLLNDIGVWGFFLASNPIIWQHQHTYAHHSFTNDEHKDPDLHHFDGKLIVHPSIEGPETNKLKGKRLYWRMILEFAYGTLGLSWLHPTLFVFDRTLHGVTAWSDIRQWHRTGQLLLHWSLYTFIILCVPFIVQQNSKLALLQIALQVHTCGLLFSCLTQVGHLADVLLNTTLIAEQRKERHPIAQQSWAAEQIVTTQDFNPLSHYTFYLATGLSLQIEHHLFPYLNHCHLMKIQPIVEKTCKEYNVSYTKRSNWTEAWNALKEYLSG